jgi:hypothetical protein
MDTPLDTRGPHPERAEGWGPAIGIVVIVALLVAGGVYFLMSGQAAGYPAPAVGAART